MRSSNHRCIILGHKNFGDSHKLVFLYCEELGKIKAIAKGARKIKSKFTGHLETLSHAEVCLYFGPRNIILTEITTLRTCQNHQQDKLENMAATLQIAQIVNQHLFENQVIEGFMELLTETIKKLPTSEKPLILSIIFLVKFCDILGLMPNFYENSFNLEKKYLKFFEFTKKHQLDQLTKITLSHKESLEIIQFLTMLIQEENSYSPSLVTFTTPLTASNLSSNKSNLSISTKSSKK